ncbi:MAG: M50 family metallopeptidase [Pirellulaceae bacterium]
MRLHGVHSSVVLYHFGGLAIPQNRFGVGIQKKYSSKFENIFISAAGPIAQLLLAAFVIVLARAKGYQIALLPEFLLGLPGLRGGQPIDSPGLFGLVNFLVWPSVMWALLNLIPVYPLDGGQIAREIIGFFGGTMRTALVVSLVSAVGMAVYGLSERQFFLTLLFASLGFSNYEMLSGGNPWRRY